MGTALFPLLLEVKRADLAAQSDYQRIQKEGDCLTLKDLAVTGRDLMAAGMKPGPQLGRTLTALLEFVLEDPGKNTKEYLLATLPKET